ncbi:N-formylglutamate deformylase [Acuticoccus mangrovi]|uniref:N-formylglutamate deformylase n=1 Tax=Acuticoccus mangrovi TaxID=2796142 RepID=A0A934ILM2_9HYPH|nr:N-formylglutamate deformylase [Acuticoccus mangrovi]MBJ3778864.1 N-formylglutamate deformylase [Acuticoccus mangrovi]
MSDPSLPWLIVKRGNRPLVLSLPHTGTDIPAGIETRLVSAALARKDADWWTDRLYAFGETMGATIVRTRISRTVIDVNRDPSGASLYPGQATTGLCSLESFDGEPLYRPGQEPDADEIAERRRSFFEPYHAALSEELARLRATADRVALYDCHSIRSVIPRLFPGTLPVFNVGTNRGTSCDRAMTAAVVAACGGEPFDHVVDGRFVGGWITRTCDQPAEGIHALQMELACRGYMREPLRHLTAEEWPAPYDEAYAEPLRARLEAVLAACLAFAEGLPAAG